MAAPLTRAVLNRTLLQRQHLLERVPMTALDMVEHLLGLQAQNPQPPYLALWSRIVGFEPTHLSDVLDSRQAVRLFLMRGTIHLVSAGDALMLRTWVQPMLDRIAERSQQSNGAVSVARDDLVAATRALVGHAPLPVRVLGEQLARRFPECPASHLANRAREVLPLVQVPPRGLWKRSGGVTYQTAESWLEIEQPATVDAQELLRRYLRAFGPARAADVTAWSRVTGLAPVFASMREELVAHRDEHGKVLFDLPGMALAEPDALAPVRFLGEYDNLWLAHADQSRVTTPEHRRRWMGPNGGNGKTVFVDGHLTGLWNVVDGTIQLDLFRELTTSERSELEDEKERLEQLLAR